MQIKSVILLVEDEKPTVDFLSLLLQDDNYKVIVAYSGEQAISLAASHCPDLVMLDLGLPDIDGLKVLEQLREWSTVPIVVVSARHNEKAKVTALDSGADDYVTKPFSNDELLARIRSVLRRSERIARKSGKSDFVVGDLRVDFVRRHVFVRGKMSHLTPIEYRILTLLCVNAGRVLTHSFILCELWGPYVKDNRLLRVNVANIRRKIEKSPANPEYILTEAGVGYRMIEKK